MTKAEALRKMRETEAEARRIATLLEREIAKDTSTAHSLDMRRSAAKSTPFRDEYTVDPTGGLGRR